MSGILNSVIIFIQCPRYIVDRWIVNRSRQVIAGAATDRAKVQSVLLQQSHERRDLVETHPRRILEFDMPWPSLQDDTIDRQLTGLRPFHFGIANTTYCSIPDV